MMQLDLHCHTEASFDSRMTVDKLADIARARGLDAIAITDHNTFAVARDLPREQQGLHFIRGIEIGTDRGDLLGLFLEAEITTRDFGKAVDAIHEQGGLAILAHPFKWTQRVAEDTLERIDGIEVYNARGQGFSRWNSNDLARHLWTSRPELIPTAGSDAHLYAEIGRGRIAYAGADGDDLETLLRTQDEPRFHRRDSSLIPEVRSQFTKLTKHPNLKQLLRFGRHLGRTGVWMVRGAGTRSVESAVSITKESG